jgi:DNA-binding PadR family transcriptional regulator
MTSIEDLVGYSKYLEKQGFVKFSLLEITDFIISCGEKRYVRALYATVHGLEKEGLIKRYQTTITVKEDCNYRVCYELTPQGCKRIQQIYAVMKKLIDNG